MTLAVLPALLVLGYFSPVGYHSCGCYWPERFRPHGLLQEPFLTQCRYQSAKNNSLKICHDCAYLIVTMYHLWYGHSALIESQLLFLLSEGFPLVHLKVTQEAESILCYQCNSTDLTNPFQCRENLPDDYDLVPLPCCGTYAE
ncbi:unnamed protein product [Nesidiocoris tenuis]|uniref:Protein quiver n=1 Tax=Nesidiocoris tenuis TaxID=355587 RepID=A0A6H5HIQ8_9HEMI|nr:unnamed protein product [Nesidiocoris tenuis]